MILHDSNGLTLHRDNKLTYSETFDNVALTLTRLHKLQFRETNFNGVNFSGLDLRNCDFMACVFTDCKFIGTNMRDGIINICNFLDCDMSKVNFTMTDIHCSTFKRTKMYGSNLDDCILGSTTKFEDCKNVHFVAGFLLVSNFMEGYDKKFRKITLTNQNPKYAELCNKIFS